MDLKVILKCERTNQKMEYLKMVFKVVKHVKSNDIDYIKNDVTIGKGAKQMCHIDNARIALQIAKDGAEVGAKAAIKLGDSYETMR